jgi:hypothetical protein
MPLAVADEIVRIPTTLLAEGLDAGALRPLAWVQASNRRMAAFERFVSEMPPGGVHTYSAAAPGHRLGDWDHDAVR